MRPATTAIASGSLTSLFFAVAREFFNQQIHQVQIPEALPVAQDLCAFGYLGLEEWRLDWRSFLIGAAVGICLGPFLDFVVIVRLSWSRAVRRIWNREVGVRSLYRFLE